jgi:hypothetical protein
VKNFELALECGGSFLLHCTIDKKSTEGREGRELLMTILEPLLGRDVDYGTFVNGVNNYCQSQWFKENITDKENIRRFLDEVTKGWKKMERE